MVDGDYWLRNHELKQPHTSVFILESFYTFGYTRPSQVFTLVLKK